MKDKSGMKKRRLSILGYGRLQSSSQLTRVSKIGETLSGFVYDCNVTDHKSKEAARLFQTMGGPINGFLELIIFI